MLVVAILPEYKREELVDADWAHAGVALCSRT